VRASRPLDGEEVRTFLGAARRASGAPRLIVHDVFDLVPTGRAVGVTSFAYLHDPPEEHFEKKARQSIRRAIRAGAACEATSHPAAFSDLYADASKRWGASYPFDLIAASAERGLALFFDVRIDGRAVGSVAALRGATHWMYWLAAQNEEGRRAEVGYLAVATMLEAARAAGIAWVNLGASAGLPGVARFKARLGGVETPVYEWRAYSSVLVALAERPYEAVMRWRSAWSKR
jgi:lipid II:glycine glycyltransferase (peptidoglycan interpeptide bridge formation enzyme)